MPWFTHETLPRSRGAGRLLFALAAAALVSGSSSPLRADEPSGTLRCERASGPGRVRCAIEARAPAGREIVWGDVAITAIPELASALRGRLADESVVTRQKTSMAWEFALVARTIGKGEVRARVRLVTCIASSREEGGDPDAGASLERCLPSTADVATVLVVGQ